jgi:hypothetical protein
MKSPSYLICLILYFFVVSCAKQNGERPMDQSPKAEMKHYMEMITPTELSASLHFLASDYFEGRATGTDGQQAAAYYLASTFAMMGVPPLKTHGHFGMSSLEDSFQLFPFRSSSLNDSSQNVLAFIEGN